MRGPGKSYSDVIIRVARGDWEGAQGSSRAALFAARAMALRGRASKSLLRLRTPLPRRFTFNNLLLAVDTKAGRAGNVIMRAFNAVELDVNPAATTRPHIGVRITA
jgi:hypothetical protein